MEYSSVRKGTDFVVNVKSLGIFDTAPGVYQVEPGMSIRDVILHMEKKFSASGRSILEAGRLKPGYVLLLNGRPVDGLDVPLKDGDDLFISVVLAGG